MILSSSQIKEPQAAKASVLNRTAQGQKKCHPFYRFNKSLLFFILQHRHQISSSSPWDVWNTDLCVLSKTQGQVQLNATEEEEITVERDPKRLSKILTGGMSRRVLWCLINAPQVLSTCSLTLMRMASLEDSGVCGNVMLQSVLSHIENLELKDKTGSEGLLLRTKCFKERTSSEFNLNFLST